MYRVMVPSTAIEEQVKACGIGLISLFGIDLYRNLVELMEQKNGKDWILEFKEQLNGLQSLNLEDTSTLLKVILRPDYPLLRDKLREGINAQIEKSQRLDLYNRLSELLQDRNQWIHNGVKGTKINLLELIRDIEWISKKLNLKILEECQHLQSSLDKELQSENETRIVSGAISQVVNEFKELADEEEPSIGSELVDTFLEHSYTLQLSGEIRDRKTDTLLSDVIGPRAAALGALFLARKPNGGRLKMTVSGEVAAYFDGRWGYLARVTSKDWFSGHLIQ